MKISCLSVLILFILPLISEAYPPEDVRLPYDAKTVMADHYFSLAERLSDSAVYDSAIFYYKKVALIYKRKKLWKQYVNTLSKIGDNYRILANYDQAESYLNEAMNTGIKLGFEVPLANVYNSLQVCYSNQGNYDQAVLFSRKALKIQLRVLGSDHSETAISYYNLGVCYRSQGNYDQAVLFLKKALTIFSKVLGQNHPNTASAYNSLGACYDNQDKYDQAIYYTQKALDIRLEIFGLNHPLTASAYNNLGFCYQRKGNYKKAVLLIKKGLNICLKVFGTDHPNTATDYGNLGSCYKNQGDYEKAFLYYQKAVKINLKVLGIDHPNTARSYNNIGFCYSYLGKYTQTAVFYKKALEINLKIFGPDHHTTATNYHNLGMSYRYQGDYNQAVLFLQRALNIYLKTLGTNHRHTARSYNNLAFCFKEQQDYTQAVYFLQKTLAVWQEIFGVNHPIMAQGYNNLGACYQGQGRYTQALSFFQKALGLNLKVLGQKHPETASTYNNLGGYYFSQSDYNQAVLFFQKALAIRLKAFTLNHPETAYSFNMLAKTFERKKDFDQSVNYCNKALSAATEPSNRPDIYLNPQLNGIISKTELLRALRQKAKSAEKLYQKTNKFKDLELSHRTARLAINLIDSMRNDNLSTEAKRDLGKNSFSLYETGIRTARKLYQLTGKEDYLFKAFNITERSKSYLLLQSLKETEAKRFANIPDSLLEQERDLKIEIAFYEKQLFEAENKKDSAKMIMYQNYLFDKKTNLRQLTEQLEKEFPDYYQLKYDTRVASVEDIRRDMLDDRSAFIEYFWGDSAVYVFTVTKEKLLINKIGTKKILTDKIMTLKTLLSAPPDTKNTEGGNKEFTALSHEIFRLIMPELDNTVNKLIIVPDGLLNYLPFDVLLTKRSSADFIDLPYLIKKYAVGYGYSATTLLQTLKKEKKKSNNLCLAFAPSYNNSIQTEAVAVRGSLDALRSGRYVSLPGAQWEVERLSDYLAGDFRFGSAATEAYFKQEAGNYGILHLAMHGETDNQQPMNSKLVFSQNQPGQEDGFLYAYELYNLKLNAEMAVLSACKTGSGQFVRGEGVMSLARGFMYAGARSVVVTHWNAADETSADLISDFYALLQDGWQKDGALRQAKLNYLQNTNNRLSHPFYWAGYSAFGDMKPILVKKNKSLWAWIITGGILFLMITFFFTRKERRY